MTFLRLQRLTLGLIALLAIGWAQTVSYTHLRAHETVLDLVCRLLLEKKKIKDCYSHILVAPYILQFIIQTSLARSTLLTKY